MTKDASNGHGDKRVEPRRVRLPGFILDEPVGLGDVVKRVTSSAGIKPCGSCIERAQRLNRRIMFTGRKK